MSTDEDFFVELPRAKTGERVEVVGESHYQAVLDAFCGGRAPEGHDRPTVFGLMPEPQNPHDANAVRVCLPTAETVGYLSREDARAYRSILHTLLLVNRVGICNGRIVGGWDRGAGDVGHYGVWLDLGSPQKCRAFVTRTFPGVKAPPPPASRPTRRAGPEKSGCAIAAAVAVLCVAGLLAIAAY